MIRKFIKSTLCTTCRCQSSQGRNQIRQVPFLYRNPYEPLKQNHTILKRAVFSSAIAFGLHIPLVKCKEEIKQQFKLPEASDLSPKEILKQSSSVAAAATVQLLQLTTSAVINASTSYRHAMAAEMLLLNRCLEFVNVEFMQEEFNDTLIAVRAEIQQAHKDLQELLGFMEYVDKLANSAAETSFLAGAEYSSFSLSDILFNAQRQISEQGIKTQSMEAELKVLQQQLVLKTIEQTTKKAKKVVSDDMDEPIQTSDES